MDWLMRVAPPSSPQPLESLPYGLWSIYSGHHKGNTLCVWLHGWGQSHQSFTSLLQQCEDLGDHLLVDFPGFGHSGLPPSAWGTDEYAEHLHPLIQSIAPQYQRIIFIGHSFGCRVSLRYVARYPNTISAMIFIGGAGLKRHLSFPKRLRRSAIRNALTFGKRLDKFLPTQCADWVRKRYGSADYLAAGPLRPILNKVVSEDLSTIADGLITPTLLIYGELDDQTPPEFGQRYHQMMPNSHLHVLSGFDHYTLLTHAKHQVSRLIVDWVSDLPTSNNFQ